MGWSETSGAPSGTSVATLLGHLRRHQAQLELAAVADDRDRDRGADQLPDGGLPRGPRRGRGGWGAPPGGSRFPPPRRCPPRVPAGSERPSADTPPAVTDPAKPFGLPIATTSWPTRSLSASPSSAAVR